MPATILLGKIFMVKKIKDANDTLYIEKNILLTDLGLNYNRVPSAGGLGSLGSQNDDSN